MVPMNSSASPVMSRNAAVISVGDALLELGGRLLGEGERDDVPRLDAGPPQDLDDPLRDHLGLAGTRARHDQQRLIERPDRRPLRTGVLHPVRPRRPGALRRRSG